MEINKIPGSDTITQALVGAAFHGKGSDFRWPENEWYAPPFLIECIGLESLNSRWSETFQATLKKNH